MNDAGTGERERHQDSFGMGGKAEEEQDVGRRMISLAPIASAPNRMI